MPTALKTTTTELPESRVRVEAEVPADEVMRSLQRTARRLGRDLRIPGFRKGKVPPPVIIRRIGRDAVLDEAVRGDLAGWYVAAIDEAGIAPVGEPQLEVGDLPGEGQPLTFSIEIGVLPEAVLGEYKGLEVGRREPEAADAAVDAELAQLRDRLARLQTAERPAQKGDFVTIDYAGSIDGVAFEGGEGRDQIVELGAGRLIPGFEEQLEGGQAGEERTIEVTFPEEYGAEELAGRDARFEIAVKEVKSKELPGLDDELAAEAGFDTLDELREDIAGRVREADEERVAGEFREAVLDSIVAQATLEVPDALVAARAAELWERMAQSLGRQGIGKDAYLQISGKTEEEILEEARPDALKALQREAVVAAIVAAEDIEPSDDEVDEALTDSAEREDVAVSKLRERLRSAGRLDDLREELAARRAIELVAEEATPITVEQAKARDLLWTPGKDVEEPVAGGSEELWTPGS